MAHFLLVLCIFLVACTTHAFNQHNNYYSSLSSIGEKKTTKVQEGTETSSLDSSKFKTKDASSLLVAPRDHYVKALSCVLLVLLGDPLLVAAKSTSTDSMEYKYLQNIGLAFVEGLPMIGIISALLNSVKGEVKADINSVKSDVKAEISNVKAEISSVKSDVKAEISSVKAEISSVMSDVGRLESRMDSVNARLDTIISTLGGRLEN
jgi:hypothetical protein